MLFLVSFRRQRINGGHVHNVHTVITVSRTEIYGEKKKIGCVQYEKSLFPLPPFFVAPPPLYPHFDCILYDKFQTGTEIFLNVF